MEYVTDRDFPNQYSDGGKIEKDASERTVAKLQNTTQLICIFSNNNSSFAGYSAVALRRVNSGTGNRDVGLCDTRDNTLSSLRAV